MHSLAFAYPLIRLNYLTSRAQMKAKCENGFSVIFQNLSGFPKTKKVCQHARITTFQHCCRKYFAWSRFAGVHLLLLYVVLEFNEALSRKTLISWNFWHVCLNWCTFSSIRFLQLFFQLHRMLLNELFHFNYCSPD